MKIIRAVVFLLAALSALTACAAWRGDTYTLSPAVKESARRYSDVMDDFADQALLANVLRARDQAPMNFNDLSSITGALSLQGTLALTLPFGHYVGNPNAATQLLGYKDTASPSIMGTTSPVINIGTLNTQGFMLTMIQPISSTYVLSKWNEGMDHRLLLYLFVKSIRFCDDRNPLDPPAACASDDAETEDPLAKAHEDATQSSTDVERAIAAHATHNDTELHAALAALHSELTALNAELAAAIAAHNQQLADWHHTQDVVLAARQLVSAVLSKVSPAVDHHQGLDAAALTEVKSGVDAISAQLEVIPTGSVPPLTDCIELAHPTDGPRRVHRNDPDDRAAMTDFKHLVNCLFDKDHPGGGDVDMKALMILDPLGIAIPFGEQISAQYPPQGGQGSPQGPSGGHGANPNPPSPSVLPDPVPFPLPAPAPSAIHKGMQLTLGSEMTLFGTISGLSDGQLHVGNASCPFYPDDDELCLHPGGVTSYVQFYKEYPAQVVLCVNTDHDTFAGHVVPAISLAEAKRRAMSNPKVAQLYQQLQRAPAAQLADLQKQFNKLLDYTASKLQLDSVAGSVVSAQVASGGGKPTGGGSAPGAGGASAAGAGATGGGTQGGAGGTTPGGMSQVTMALIPNRVSAIIPSEYCAKDQLVLTPSTEEQFDVTTTGFAHVEWRSIAEVIQYLGAIARHANNQPSWNETDGSRVITHSVFNVRDNSSGRIRLDYGGSSYSVGRPFDENPHQEDSGEDHSLESLALVNELISIAKISGTLPVSQPVQVLP